MSGDDFTGDPDMADLADLVHRVAARLTRIIHRVSGIPPVPVRASRPVEHGRLGARFSPDTPKAGAGKGSPGQGLQTAGSRGRSDQHDNARRAQSVGRS